MQRQSLRPGMGVHAGGQQGLETQAQTQPQLLRPDNFQKSKTWAGKKPLAGAGRQGSECWLLRW